MRQFFIGLTLDISNLEREAIFLKNTTAIASFVGKKILGSSIVD